MQQQSQVSIFPPTILAAFDRLVDRMNAASGYNVHDSNPTSSTQPLTPPVRALLIGTNDGVSLARSFGSSQIASTSKLREDILASIETVWATLPSGCPPQVMISSPPVAAETGISETYQQPPHHLLRPLGLGDKVKTVTAFYDNFVLIHYHLAPLVVTILTAPNANLGFIRATAFPILKQVLEPFLRAIIVSRTEAATASSYPNSNLSMNTSVSTSQGNLTTSTHPKQSSLSRTGSAYGEYYQ